MKNRSLLFILILIFVGFSPVIEKASQVQNQEKIALGHNNAQENENPRARRNQVSELAERREALIDEELARSKKAGWAGEYYCGDRLGYNIKLKIAPQNGFIFIHSGCMGIYGSNHGDVAVDGNLWRLNFTEPEGEVDNRDVTPELLPVRWGQRHYLIATDRVIDFCNAINNGFEPGRFGRLFLLKDGDEKKKVSGDPTIPAQYRDYLLKKPLWAKVTAILKRTEIKEDYGNIITTEVSINIGSADGLRPGMELRVVQPAASTEIEITEVEAHSAQGRIVQLDFEKAVPVVGWKAVTGLRKL